jgi:L-2-amino-thiazoline-4-carboxylic acid hydrolase-like protein
MEEKMKVDDIPIIVRREIEVQIVNELYQVMADSMGNEDALDLVVLACENAARAAGKAYAASAPDGPSMAHFASFWDKLAAGPGSLDIKDLKIGDKEMTLTVTRCGYLELYDSLGVPPELGVAFSCSRDAGFADGYSPKLKMERPLTIGDGEQTCTFRYTWED